MKIKNIISVLLIAFIVASCAPTKIAVPTSTFMPIPPTATTTPTLIPESPTLTNEPTATLSTEGPWLVYLHNSPRMRVYDVMGVDPKFVIINQDGSAPTSITVPECNRKTVNEFLINGQNSANYMAHLNLERYLFRPSDATGMLVYNVGWHASCSTFLSDNEKGGLLTSIYQATNGAVPELMIYELPSGKIRNRFPLVKCVEDASVCEKYRDQWSQMGEQQPQWSRNGRYLAFVALLDATSSDLFVYDKKDGSVRRLTSGPDWVGEIAWSPDGEQIIMQELLADGENFLSPASRSSTSVWSVSTINNDIKLLYPVGNKQNILWWLDNKRFIAYEGEFDALDIATNLRMVDTDTGVNRVLFDGNIVNQSLDPIHEVFALYALYSDEYQQGIYLVSTKNSTIRYLKDNDLQSFPEWDEKTGLFVSEDDCENDPQRLQTFDYSGKFQCLPKPTPESTPVVLQTIRYQAPNEQSAISLKDGIWLETKGNAVTQISAETASNVIWCPDSTCFFFSVQQKNKKWTLYRVSISDLAIKMVDEGIESTGHYQWLGSEK